MKSSFRLAALAALLLATCSQCLALISIANVSREQAREMGIQIRAKPNGPSQAWIELEFRPEGRLKDFQHVSLEVRDARAFLLGWTPLKERRSGSGTVLVNLMGNRDFLEKVTLRIVSGTFSSSGHDLRITDFVDLKQLR